MAPKRPLTLVLFVLRIILQNAVILLILFSNFDGIFMHKKNHEFFVMHQSVNLFPYSIILPLLGVQNQGFPGEHDPRRP